MVFFDLWVSWRPAGFLLDMLWRGVLEGPPPGWFSVAVHWIKIYLNLSTQIL
jgi:hypothetical protein